MKINSNGLKKKYFNKFGNIEILVIASKIILKTFIHTNGRFVYLLYLMISIFTLGSDIIEVLRLLGFLCSLSLKR